MGSHRKGGQVGRGGGLWGAKSPSKPTLRQQNFCRGGGSGPAERDSLWETLTASADRGEFRQRRSCHNFDLNFGGLLLGIPGIHFTEPPTFWRVQCLVAATA